MQLKSIYLGLSFDEIIPEVAEEGHAAEHYAVALCAEEQAHLSVFMTAPIFRIPSAGLLRSWESQSALPVNGSGP
jgi:hypothetical protein